ncbi:MAG: Spy/CpxP family protein refolding chaperone [Armatimonadetes bacterium]|nr:Spy/CpxP family protein refolding chaperone [Armatimonadota bacterium]
MRNRFSMFSAIAVLVITATVVVAQAPRMGPRNAGGGMICDWTQGKIARELALTKDQMDKIKQIHMDFMNATKDTREQLRAKCEQMVALWSVDQPDAAAIKNLLSEIDPLKAQLRDMAVDHAVQAYNVLTPAQKIKARAMLKAHLGHMRKGCWMGGDMGG